MPTDDVTARGQALTAILDAIDAVRIELAEYLADDADEIPLHAESGSPLALVDADDRLRDLVELLDALEALKTKKKEKKKKKKKKRREKKRKNSLIGIAKRHYLDDVSQKVTQSDPQRR